MNVKRFFSGIVLSLISVAILLAILEFVLQYVPVVDNSYPESSWWYKAKWYDSHRNSNEKFSYAIDEYHPAYGWVLKAGLNNFPFANYFISSTGSNTRVTGEPSASDTGSIKILALGDSFTFGECVNDSDTYPAFLQDLIPNSKVINAGVHGWGHDQVLLRLKLEGNTHQPAIVLLGCFNGDLARNHLRFRDYAKPYYHLENDSLILKGLPVSSPDELLSGFHPRLFDFVSSRLAPWFDKTDIQEADVLSGKILLEIVKECRKINAIPVFVYLPWQDECINANSNPAMVFQEICKKEGVLWIDPTDSVHAYIKNLSKPEQEFTCHYTPEVNEAIAKKIAVVLHDRKIIY